MTWNENITHWIWFWVANPTQNYANSDEMLLDDRNRPRDEYWFRLRPWRQMGKNDYRASNSGITEYLEIFWWVEWSKNSTVVIPFAFDNTGKLTLTSTYSYPAEQYEKWMKSTKIWKTSWAVKNRCLVIPTTWLYVISYMVNFTFPSWASRSTDPKCIVQLSTIIDWVEDWLDSAWWYCIATSNKVGHTIIKYLEWGTMLTLMGYYSTSTSYKCLFRGQIEIMQVS